MNVKFYRKLTRQFDRMKLADAVWNHKKLSLGLLAGFLVLLYITFNSNGILQHYRLKREKEAVLEKIRIAEEEQQKLQQQSKALDGDQQAIEKVAREKYGMVRPGEKVYKVVPKKK